MNICSICIEPLGIDTRTTVCGHSFHHACLTKWITINPSCPICRRYTPLCYKTSFRIKLKRGKFIDRIVPQMLQIGEDTLTIVNRLGTVIEIMHSHRIQSVELHSDKTLIVFRSIILGGKVMPVEIECIDAATLHAAIGCFFSECHRKYKDANNTN